jgi:hypothetical protein
MKETLKIEIRRLYENSKEEIEENFLSTLKKIIQYNAFGICCRRILFRNYSMLEDGSKFGYTLLGRSPANEGK